MRVVLKREGPQYMDGIKLTSTNQQQQTECQ